MEELHKETTLYYHMDVFVLQKCLVEGANINHRTSRGETPLLYAFMAYTPEHNEKIDFLLANGASPNIPDNQGTYPIMLCKNVEMLQLLLRYGAHTSIPLHKLLAVGCPRMLHCLLANGFDILNPDSPNYAPNILRFIASVEQYRIIKAHCAGKVALPIRPHLLIEHLVRDPKLYNLMIYMEKIERNSVKQQLKPTKDDEQRLPNRAD
jgi:ankyrin repeat protein